MTDVTSGLFLNGKVVSIEDYKADTQIYLIIQPLSSVISLFASLGIVCILYRSYKKMAVPFHRLLLGLSVADIYSSFAQAWSTLLLPSQPFGRDMECERTSAFVSGPRILYL